MKVRIVGLITFTALVALSIIVALIVLSNNTLPSQAGRPAPFIWKDQPELATAQNSEGSFSIRVMMIKPQKMLWFYAMKSAYNDIPDVTAIALNKLSGIKSDKQPTVDKTQELGKLGDFRVGVIHLSYTSQVGQVISVQVAPFAGAKQKWEVSPVVQVNEIEQPYTWIIPFFDKATIVGTADSSIGDTNYFRFQLAGQSESPGNTLFLNIGPQMAVLPLSQAQYRAAVPKMASPQPNLKGEKTFTPAPMNPNG